MKNNLTQDDVFRDSMMIFLDYVNRQYKKNPDYKPHPIIRAFNNALEGIKKIEVGKTIVGLSQNGTKEKVYNPYMVILEKTEKGINVKDIKNLQVNKSIPIDIMILTFRLQIKLDKIKSEFVTPKQIVDILNEIIPGNNFFYLGDKWKKYLPLFKEKFERGEIHYPRDSKLAEEIKNINYNIPWEDYSNRQRAFIGGVIGSFIDLKGKKIIITSPKNAKIKKYVVFDCAMEFQLGKTSNYLKQI
jgi:hypothetical protein